MKKGWTTTKLITVGALSVLSLFAQIILVKGIFLVTGSIFGAVFVFLISPFFSTLTVLLTRQFGAATTFRFIIGIFNLPLPSVIPPIVGLFIEPFTLGLSTDYLYRFITRKQLFSFIAGFVNNLLLAVEVIVIYFTIGLSTVLRVPSIVTAPGWLIGLTLFFAFVGGLSGLGAYFVYNKLSLTSVVKRIQGNI